MEMASELIRFYLGEGHSQTFASAQVWDRVANSKNSKNFKELANLPQIVQVCECKVTQM